MGARSKPVDVILVGAGRRARAWADRIHRSPRLRGVALVTRAPTPALPGFPAPCLSLDAALDEHPTARVAVALPPRAGLQIALDLDARGTAAVVQSPLGAPAAPWSPRADGSTVQVAHGWTTLPGCRWLVEALGEHPAQLRIEVQGLPEEAGGDLDEVVIHALALCRRLCPDPRVERVSTDGERVLTTELSGGGSHGGVSAPHRTLHLHATAGGWSLSVTARRADQTYTWRWRDDRETLAVAAPRSGTRERRTAGGAERALHQLLAPGEAGGDDLRAAARVHALAADVFAAAPRRLCIGARPLRHAGRLAQERPDALLDRLGLAGDVPAAPPAPEVSLLLPPGPLERWPFRAGLKPVVFLTLTAREEAPVRALFPGTHIERRERRVEVGAGDAWLDDRSRGEPRVELYIARDRALAERAAALQAEDDPSARSIELGELMGYPRCCVEAFAAAGDRSHNTRNRYRTAARSHGAAPPWPWELNNTFVMLVPFFPCSYTCTAALRWARATLGAMEPATVEALRDALAAPVLYFDDDHAMVLRGDAGDRQARYADPRTRYLDVRVAPRSSADFARLAGAFSLGERLVLETDRLQVPGVVELERTDPALGLLLPFGSVRTL